MFVLTLHALHLYVMYMCYISWTFEISCYNGPVKIIKKLINIEAQKMQPYWFNKIKSNRICLYFQNVVYLV